MRTKLHECFDRHPGRYDVVHWTERAGLKDGSIERVRVRVYTGIHADEAAQVARREVMADASASMMIFAASHGDNGHIATVTRKNIDDLLQEETDGRVERSDQRTAAALLPEREEPVLPVDDPVDRVVPAAALPVDRPVRDVPPAAPADDSTAVKAERRPRGPRATQLPEQSTRLPATKLPGDRFPAVRGRQLALGEGTWPPSAAAQAVRAFFTADRRATSAEVVAALGAQLQALGMAHPASLVSRLKQAGLLKEIA